MSRLLRILLVLIMIAAAMPAASSQAASQIDSYDQQNCMVLIGLYGPGGSGLYGSLGGATFCYVIPANWNHDLVIFAHGYVDPTTDGPVEIPYEQLLLPGTTDTLPGLVTRMGYAFAITSYSKKGLAVEEGVADVVALANAFRATNTITRFVYLIGASEGGLVTTLAIEKFGGSVFKGGVATCGPVGDFQKQINYWGDFRVIFDYFFPNALLPLGGNPVTIPPTLPAMWRTYTTKLVGPFHIPEISMGPAQQVVAGLVLGGLADPSQPTANLIATTRAPVDPANPGPTAFETTMGLLGYNVLATMDGIKTLHGQPFNNMTPPTFYHDPLIPSLDPGINATVFRIASDRPNLSGYQTTGRLGAPLVTMHNTGDPIVPYWHEMLYFNKVISRGSFWKYINIPIARYGHCNFKPSEALFAFWLMVIRSGVRQVQMMDTANILSTQEERDQFIQMAAPYIQGGYTIYMPITTK
jgi:pimeloyl-ACP methyl ester carboxylesterase